MNLEDALYNWLSIKKVVEGRPDDQAAKDTYEFFGEILGEDHHVKNLEVLEEEPFYIVVYTIDEEWLTKKFPMELIDALFDSIQAEPKYN
ncbi:hypothetical protein [Alkalihalobacillus sp. AL-G]|uniref:hypothetical protein n=1 Tax=Alkalihalobacillus sp. AL-G TaxID=2926399 RepID=UPI00272DAA1B|nr:hypothetical protein [Alkalihalobacillus sp. AL-G]WLD95016.1 hypothetical protein MOJ78_09085 [Alkalihalobacillus sp. AL-G]